MLRMAKRSMLARMLNAGLNGLGADDVPDLPTSHH